MLFGPYSDLLKEKLSKLDNFATTARMSELKEKLANTAILLEQRKHIEDVIDFQQNMIRFFTVPALIGILFFQNYFTSKHNLKILYIILEKDPSWNKRSEHKKSAEIFKDICLDIIHCDLTDRLFLLESIFIAVENERENFLNECGKNYLEFIAPTIEALSCSSKEIEKKVTIEYTPLYMEVASKLTRIKKSTGLQIGKPTISGSSAPSPVPKDTGTDAIGLSPCSIRISKK
ncbi:MAG: hypothetical protein HYX61_07730 [Gammaproteobacteria bacterium]|jgi:hypothetical protein|nr:hypothetical protein [Gammaproteobacteria bacterium]